MQNLNCISEDSYLTFKKNNEEGLVMKVKNLSGFYPDLAIPDKIIPVDDLFVTSSGVFTKVKNLVCHHIKDESMVKIVTEFGHLVVAPNYKITLCVDGEFIDTDAAKIKIGDKLFYNSGAASIATVLKVQVLNYTGKAYSLETATHHYDINGFLAHNCSLELLPEDERIWVRIYGKEKLIPIKETVLYAPEKLEALSLNPITHEVEWKPIYATHESEIPRDLITIITSDNRQVTVTSDHLIMTSEGYKIPKEAKDIIINIEDHVESRKISKLEFSNSKGQRLYSISVQDNENFATEDGLFIHNHTLRSISGEDIICIKYGNSIEFIKVEDAYKEFSDKDSEIWSNGKFIPIIGWGKHPVKEWCDIYFNNRYLRVAPNVFILTDRGPIEAKNLQNGDKVKLSAITERDFTPNYVSQLLNSVFSKVGNEAIYSSDNKTFASLVTMLTYSIGYNPKYTMIGGNYTVSLSLNQDTQDEFAIVEKTESVKHNDYGYSITTASGSYDVSGLPVVNDN